MPVWKYPFTFKELSQSQVLIFGGYQKDIFVMHPEKNKVDVLKDDGIFFDTQFKLEEPDTFSD